MTHTVAEVVMTEAARAAFMVSMAKAAVERAMSAAAAAAAAAGGGAEVGAAEAAAAAIDIEQMP